MFDPMAQVEKNVQSATGQNEVTYRCRAMQRPIRWIKESEIAGTAKEAREVLHSVAKACGRGLTGA